MWWILSALLVAIVWALHFILSAQIPIWIPEVATAVIVFFALALFVFRRIRAKQAAGALERAIAHQGAQQALNARPERRAEIQELQKQVQTGITALKTSKLGGRKGGASALYSLPWYVIIGPPGAGKTTALKHSGLVFPYADSSGGGVRGVGGTRNCDWWFTNEAILLDTAGRYTTEQDDHDEWIAFLQMLRKYRTRRPINGILVAISVADLIDANEQQLEATGKKVRARIDEVMTQLHMVVPVYVLFTKCDLIAGFNEFFNDLRKSDRAQAWGTTLKLDLLKTEPAKLFDAEFDILTKQVHARSLKRLAGERNREARERVYQFPLEFAGIKRNLSELIGATFQVNAFQGTPIFRGFYFTSGTQEGRPLDRVLGRMGQAMGIRTAETAAQQVVESKSYFLHDVFMNVVFPDGDVAARSAGEVRRQALMRLSVSLAAAALAVIVAFPAVLSYRNNRELVQDTQERVKAANAIHWGDGRPAPEKLAVLKPVLERLVELDAYRGDLPMSMGWMMYQGEALYRPSVAVYVSSLQNGFVSPCKQKLEERLKQVKGDKYLAERLLLKTYLMLSDVEHLDVDWATGRFTQIWADVLHSSSSVPDDQLKAMLRDHVQYYFRLLKSGKVKPLPPVAALVDSARKTLMGVGVNKRYYDVFVNSLIEEKNDESAESSRANSKYPSLRLDDLFVSRPDVLKVMTSARYTKEKVWKEVEGPYTEKGHYAVVKNITLSAGLLEREQWVVPLTAEEQGDRVPANLRHLADDYDQRYVDAWTDFATDIIVAPPASIKEAIDLYTVLARPDWAYLRVLHAMEDHTQFKRDQGQLENDDANRLVNQRVNNALSQKLMGVQFKFDIKKLGADRVSVVPGIFRSTIAFGVPPDARAGAATQPIGDTPLAKYVSVLTALRDDMQKQFDANPNVDYRMMTDRLTEAASATNASLQPADDKAKVILTPWLMNPLKVGQMKLPTASLQRPLPPARFHR